MVFTSGLLARASGHLGGDDNHCLLLGKFDLWASRGMFDLMREENVDPSFWVIESAEFVSNLMNNDYLRVLRYSMLQKKWIINEAIYEQF